MRQKKPFSILTTEADVGMVQPPEAEEIRNVFFPKVSRGSVFLPTP